jgi:hypothetical protein
MAAGGVLISSPILIHLINRMRFKRIRWAAMEFLLKSQKRNRRRLIIEQMILLLLRILLVLLAAFLVARLLYAGAGSKGATHVVILDDTLSMADRDGKNKTAFGEGKAQVLDLAERAAQAPSAQFMKVYLLSDLDKPLFDKRLNDGSKGDIEAAFNKAGSGPTMLHTSVLAGLKKGRDLLNEVKQGQKVLHIVSDFRDRDWADGADAEALAQEVQAAVKDDISLHLVDVASPTRDRSTEVVRSNDNLAVVDFSANPRVATAGTDVEFTVHVMNYGATEPQPPPRLTVRVNGEVDKAATTSLGKVPAGELSEHKFKINFPTTDKGAAPILPGDGPEERERKRRQDRRYFHVQVDIGREAEKEVGLLPDNTRDLVMEVRQQRMPILVIDGNKDGNTSRRSDIDTMDAAFDGYNREFTKEPIELDYYLLKDVKLATIDLSLYPSIILLNVGEVGDEAVIARLKAYVAQGGSILYCLGEQVKPSHYNDKLFAAGLFPVKITDEPFDPVHARGHINLDDRRAERERLAADEQENVLLPRQDHPVVQGLIDEKTRFPKRLRDLGINVYWKARPRSQWDPTRKTVEELLVLPNPGDVNTYRERALELVARARQETATLAKNEAEMKGFERPVEKYESRVRDALIRGRLSEVAHVLQEMLTDPGQKANPDRPRMPDLWRHVAMQGVKAELEEFRDTVLYGDPLLVSKASGRGRVVALLTTAGPLPRPGVSEPAVTWNGWQEAGYGITTYPLLQRDLLRYLVLQGGQTFNYTVGQGLELKLPARIYAEKDVVCTFTPQPDLEQGAPDRLAVENLEPVALTKDKDNLLFKYPPVKRPGVLRVSFALADPRVEMSVEERAFAFNLDTAEESNLKRAPRERLEQGLAARSTGAAGSGAGVTLRGPGQGTDDFKERQPDASESPWLYLFFILILVAEQAMAVHLSFHLRGTEAAPAAAAPRAAAAAA